MKEEFNLSEKMRESSTFGGGVLVVGDRDVKKFIKKLKEKLMNRSTPTNDYGIDVCLEEIDKLAGEKLK